MKMRSTRMSEEDEERQLVNNSNRTDQAMKLRSKSNKSIFGLTVCLIALIIIVSCVFVVVDCQKTSQKPIDSNSTSRPLERPSLNLVTKRLLNGNSQNSNNDSAPPTFPEGAADWFMMGGADDLTADESRPSAVQQQQPTKQRRTISSTRRMAEVKQRRSSISAGGSKQSANKTIAFDDDSSASSSSSDSSTSDGANDIYDDPEESASSMAGTQKEPECASHGRYYCTFKEDYPLKLVTEVTKYYKWPLEKLFRDLHAQIMPKLAQDSTGNLVCDSVTRVVRPGWARNTNDRWLVVINTDNYHQYVTEVVCQYGTNSRCNFIPPCYYSSCQQRYNTQKLLVIDPTNPYRGPFLSEFLFPSCCVCYVPSTSESLQDKYRSSPATIYQRTMQQEAASNLNPPQFRPPGLSLLEEAFSSAVGSTSNLGESRVSSSLSSSVVSSAGVAQQSSGASGSASAGKATPSQQPPGPGEIRRAGDLRRGEAAGADQERHGRQLAGSCPSCQHQRQHNYIESLSSFPRLGLDDSLLPAGGSAEKQS